MIERAGRRFTIRPEKIRIVADGDADAGLHVEPGTVTDASYVGQATRFEIALDGGGRLLVTRQNLETSHDEARDLRGRPVRVGWREDQTFAVGRSDTPPEEEAA